MHTKTEVLKNKIKGVKNKVIDKASDVMSFPKRAYYGRKEKQGNLDTKVIKSVRLLGKHRVPDFDSEGNVTNAAHYRARKDAIEMKYKNK